MPQGEVAQIADWYLEGNSSAPTRLSRVGSKLFIGNCSQWTVGLVDTLGDDTTVIVLIGKG